MDATRSMEYMPARADSMARVSISVARIEHRV